MEFVDGNNLKNILAAIGANNELRELRSSKSYIDSSDLNKYYLRKETEQKYLNDILQEESKERIQSDFKVMIDKKFIYEDIKYGNLILNKNNIYWVYFKH